MKSGKVMSSFSEAVSDIGDGSTIIVGGFGLSGIPECPFRHLKSKEQKI